MTAPVLRDVDIVAPVVVRAPVVETATATANGQPLTILNSSTTPGAALPAAVAAAGANSTVVLAGTYATTAVVALQAGQTLTGTSPIIVRTPSGATATLTGPGATINGSFNTAGTGVVALSPNGTLIGMTINSDGGGSVSSTAVWASAASGARIHGNTIMASGSGGVATNVNGIILTNGSSNVVLSNNTINITSTNAQNLQGINASPGGFSTVTISNNTVTITGTSLAKYGIGTAGGVPGGTIATITGNTISVTGAGGTNRAVHVINSAITAGSTDNVRVNGVCSYQVGNSGSIGFTDGTPCP